MSRLIPTPTVDKNGRLTTVHKRQETPRHDRSALAATRPSLGGGAHSNQQSKHEFIVKPKKLPKQSSAHGIAISMGISKETVDENRSPVTLTEDEGYRFLRHGIPLQDAAALKGVGIEIRDIDEITADSHLLPGSINKVRESSTIYRTQTRQVLDLLEESGIAAEKADKVLDNGLQDGHLNQALDAKELVGLFSKWSYRGSYERRVMSRSKQNEVIDNFVSGKLPLSMMQYKIAELESVSFELRNMGMHKSENGSHEALADMEYRERLCHCAVEKIDGEYRPLDLLHGLINTYGEDVMELDDPRMADITMHYGGGNSENVGVEGAKYLESVHRMAMENDDTARYTDSKKNDSLGGVLTHQVYLRHYELYELYKAGVPEQVTYEMMVHHNMKPEQIIISQQDNINSTLTSGAL